MIHLQRYAQGEPAINFVAAIQALMPEIAQLYLLGFVVCRHPEWIRLRRAEREGWRTIYPDRDDDPGVLRQREEYFTGDGEDEVLLARWKSFSGVKDPFVIKVCVGPTSPQLVTLRRQIEARCAAEGQFYSIVEERAPAFLAAMEGGRNLTVGINPGTIGGFLEDAHGTKFGLTCGHVGQATAASAYAQDVSGATVLIGNVVETNWPLNASSGMCQPAAMAPSSTTPKPNRVDIAVLDVSGGHSVTNRVRGVGSITGMTYVAGLGSSHRVQMGADAYDITGYIMTYRTSYAGSHYCFENVYEISGVAVNSFLASYTPVPKPGDSGAWVCCPGAVSGMHLCGMLFAADRARGYVCFTDEIESWAKSKSLYLTTF